VKGGEKVSTSKLRNKGGATVASETRNRLFAKVPGNGGVVRVKERSAKKGTPRGGGGNGINKNKNALAARTTTVPRQSRWVSVAKGKKIKPARRRIGEQKGA